MATTIASPSQNAVAVGAHTLENSVREKPSKQAANGVKPAFLATDSILEYRYASDRRFLARPANPRWRIPPCRKWRQIVPRPWFLTESAEPAIPQPCYRCCNRFAIGSPLRSVGLHKLKGARKKQWAMTVNDRWRICFEFRNGDAFDVEIV
jgi:hypothetical protein